MTRRTSIISIALIGAGLAICGWQADEHLSFEHAVKGALIKRGRDITSTLGVVIRSQRRYGLLVVKERIEPSLQALVQSEGLASIAILPSTGEPLASAGSPVDLTPQQMREGGVTWGAHTLTIMNLIDLGSSAEDRPESPEAIVMTDSERKSMRPPGSRGAPRSVPRPRPAAAGIPFGRPSWMTTEQYDAVIQKQGVHSLVISLPTDELHREIQSDLLLRSMIGLLALSGGLIASLAWRNFDKNVELRIRLVKAVEMNAHLKEKSMAAAGLAHETRNPLNLIRGLAQILALDTASQPKLRSHVSAIIEEVDHVTAQLNDFIDYSKPREIHPGPVKIQRLVADIAQTLLADIEDKQVTLAQPETSCVIEADELLMRQALFNILLNALQAVEANGHIDIRVAQTTPREAVLEISDDGPGVLETQCENIFKPYVTMRPKGVGLGLAIVQQIVAAHCWNIVCLANEPRGARFRLTGLKVVGPAE